MGTKYIRLLFTSMICFLLVEVKSCVHFQKACERKAFFNGGIPLKDNCRISMLE